MNSVAFAVHTKFVLLASPPLGKIIRLNGALGLLGLLGFLFEDPRWFVLYCLFGFYPFGWYRLMRRSGGSA